jgi:hypothetical protein
MDPVLTRRRRWDIDISGGEIESLRIRKIGRDLREDEWENIRDTAAEILGQCPNPGEKEAKVTGLALGKVQSGKTLSYTALIALAVDNGYRITIVLVGTKNPLLEQNYTRLCNDLGARSRPTLTPFKNPLPQDAEVIESVLRGRGHVLIVALKHRKRIDDIRRILAMPELRGFSTLVIDDEGDEASLNTQFRKGRRSAIYESILRLRDSLQTHAYIAYTATPQANLLISGIDGLAPDFGVLVQPGQNYCGGSVFFGPNRNRFIREVPPEEKELSSDNCIPDGLRLAIATFLVGGAIRHLREPHAWYSMLIHNSNLRVDHDRLKTAVLHLRNLWKEKLAMPDSDPTVEDLLGLFHAAYDDLCQTVRNVPAWEQVRQQLREEILLEVWMVNSLPLGRDPIGTPFRLRNNILIGGNMLGRGVTFLGLAVTYITRRAKNETNADTMEQRARWFGYKQEYLDICRIFLTPELSVDYTELLRHEDDFWETLGRNKRQGISIRDWPRMLALDMGLGLRPTRQAVASFKQFRGQGWERQRKITVDPVIARQNVQKVQDFFRDFPGEVRAYASTEHIIVRNCPTDAVIRDLLAKLETDDAEGESAYTREYLARLWLGGYLPTIDVLWINKGNPRRRSLAKDHNGKKIPDKIDNPFEGRTDGKRPEERDYYPGDENLHGGNPQLQVSLVRPEGADPTTTVVCLYIPNADRYNLRFVVRDEVQ